MTKYAIFPEDKFLSKEEHQHVANALDKIVFAYWSSVGGIPFRRVKNINADLEDARKELAQVKCKGVIQ